MTLFKNQLAEHKSRLKTHPRNDFLILKKKEEEPRATFQQFKRDYTAFEDSTSKVCTINKR